MTRWFHGGRPGLKPGKRVLPPSVTGTPTSAEILARMGADPWKHGLEADRARRDLVYLTSAEDLAAGKAAFWHHKAQIIRVGPQLARLPQWGSVYEVLPPPGAEPEPDPDFEEGFPGLCVQVPYATVFRVTRRRVEMTDAGFARVMLRYTTWHAGPCPGCGHDSRRPDPGCRCGTACLCEIVRLDPTAVQRVR
jgi:hypothetical protein